MQLPSVQPAPQLAGAAGAPPPGLAAAVGAAPIAVPVVVLPVIVAPIVTPMGAGNGDHDGPKANPAPHPTTKLEIGSRPAAAGPDSTIPLASYRTGYADYLRVASTKEIAAMALPGVSGMVALTGLGGLLGFRQARAGRTVRIDAARFMR
ncbi:hypothetical protein M2272_001987 [Mycobacterium frederiksbergense]|uniref:Uncharacterized protein n=1 Tax=Mycolicibacterium frederiksbergense TaxID=117567 RepID=A0ABT6KZB6_9MYCO|nr:hypothetical protein [Mycolicibacterium frederiksbergense]MDH6195347.1 hypothetical protein [Mycolicibacterium frederiksbergense]